MKYSCKSRKTKQKFCLHFCSLAGGIFLKVCLQGQGLSEKTKCFMVDNLMRNNTVQNRVVANFISKTSLCNQKCVNNRKLMQRQFVSKTSKLRQLKLIARFSYSYRTLFIKSGHGLILFNDQC